MNLHVVTLTWQNLTGLRACTEVKEIGLNDLGWRTEKCLVKAVPGSHDPYLGAEWTLRR
jgi:hypothetical protein